MILPGLLIHAFHYLNKFHEILCTQADMPVGTGKEKAAFFQVSFCIFSFMPLDTIGRCNRFNKKRSLITSKRPNQPFITLQFGQAILPLKFMTSQRGKSSEDFCCVLSEGDNDRYLF